MDPERGPNQPTPDELEELLRRKGKPNATPEELETGDTRQVDDEVATGEVGDNDEPAAPAVDSE